MTFEDETFESKGEQAVCELVCGCAEEEKLIPVLRDALTFIEGQRWDELTALFGGGHQEFTPFFYTFMGALGREDWITHGVAIRFPFLTDKGKQLLADLQKEAKVQ